MTNPYAPPNNERDKLEQKEKFLIGEVKSHVTGALTMLTILMMIISFKKVITVDEIYYIAISLLGMSFITDMLIIWKYRCR
jgi:hypothetical protein